MRINPMQQVGGVYKPGKVNKTYGSNLSAAGKDSLAISDFAKELQVARQSVQQAPEIRQTKVDAIRQQMEAGQYNVSAAQIADKLINKYYA